MMENGERFAIDLGISTMRKLFVKVLALELPQQQNLALILAKDLETYGYLMSIALAQNLIY